MTPQLNAALAKAKLEFPRILANRTVNIPTKSGRQISFTYAELEEILEAVTPVLSLNSLSLSSQMQYLPNNKFVLTTSLRHDSGEILESHFPLPESVGDAKELGIQISYGRRYNALCLLEISTVEPSNKEQWQQTKRKLASELRTEIKETSHKVEEDYKLAVRAGQQPVPNKNNARIAEIRTALGLDKSVVIDWLRSAGGYSEPSQIASERCDALVKFLCLHWASQRYTNSYHANNSFDKRVLGAIASGLSELEAIKQWMQYAEELKNEVSVVR